MKSIIVVCLLLLPSTGMASQWCGFKGIYVGMSAEAAKKKGLSTCSKGQSVDEICKPDGSNKDLTTFGGEPTKGIEIGIQKGKVIIIGFKTEGRYGGGLEKTMITKYGKPAKKDRKSVV